METLSNFNSIYCFITFIIIEVVMLFILFIITKEQKNKVKFFVEKSPNYLELLMKDKNGRYLIIGTNTMFWRVKLHEDDFSDMKVGEIREVFINLED